MRRDLKCLAEKEFDLLVIGGGITGAFLAYDAALRGIKTALIEKGDFGMATSSASSKILHGGVRYLQNLQLNKVRESARERTFFQVIAPQLTTTVPFIIPTYQGSFMKGRTALCIGMWLYRLLCSHLNSQIEDCSKKVPFGRLFGKSTVLSMASILRNISRINGGHTLYEVHMTNSERMTLQVVKSAAARGAVVANYCMAEDFSFEEGRVVGASCVDTLSGEKFSIRARMTANAAGPFLPALNRRIPGIKLRKETTGFSKGVHLVTRQLEGKYALALSSGRKTEGVVTRGGRHIFIIPWRGRSLIGTTNVPFEGTPDEVCVTEKDIVDFLADINEIVPGIGLERKDVYYAFSGLYPLLSDEIKTDTYQGHGEYQLVDHAAKDGVEGIVSVLGAKYTTARAVAEQAVDMIASRFGCEEKSETSFTSLVGGEISDFSDFQESAMQRYAHLFDQDIIIHLVRTFGSELDEAIAWMREKEGALDRVCEGRGCVAGEILWAVEKEMACTLEDVVFARTGLGSVGYPGREVLESAADIMQMTLSWPEGEKKKQLDIVERHYQLLTH